MQADPVTPAQDSTSASEIASLVASWRLSLAARRVSPATIATYTSAVFLLREYLTAQGMPTAADRVRREHVEEFLTDLLARRAPATAHNRFRGCQAFFNWLLDEGEIRTSPMARMKPPRLPEAPVPVLRDVELRKLLEACARDKTFAGRRDEAILRDRPRALDTSRARERFGFLAKTSFDDGLRQTVAWYEGRVARRVKA